MQVSNNSANSIDAYKQNSSQKVQTQDANQTAKNVDKNVEEIINNSATKVAISMNAQYILFEMNAKSMAKNSMFAQAGIDANSITKDQQSVLDFLSGKGKIDDMSLSDIGYNGKPIMELSQDEATQLVSEDGFFGVTQTSDRVANFVFSFAGDDLEKLQKVEMELFKVLKRLTSFLVEIFQRFHIRLKRELWH